MTAATSDRPALRQPPQERARALKPLITQLSAEAQVLRYLPRELANALFDAGLFRMWLPELYGGDNADTRTVIETIEEISSADGSTGWNYMIGSQVNGMVAATIPIHLGEKLFANPRLSMFGGGGPGTMPSKAVRQADGGYRITGRSTYQSGCHNASYALPVCAVFEADGETPVLNADGQPLFRTFLVPRDQWEIADTWDVSGLRGSGSHDVVFDNAYVAPEWSSVQLNDPPALHPNPIYRMSMGVRIVFSKTAVATGIARGAIDAFATLASEKTPYQTSALLRDRSLTQFRMAEAVALVESGRAWLLQVMREMEEYLDRTGAPAATDEQMRDARLACAFTTQNAVRAVELLHQTAGTTSNHMASPLERRMRDVHTVAVHKWLAWPLMEELGKALLGAEVNRQLLYA